MKRFGSCRCPAAVLAGLLAVTLLSCRGKERDGAGSSDSGRPNIIVIVMDTARADHLSLSGWHRETTPNLKEFARESVVYTNARTVSPWTLPSHMSLFSGLLPGQHGAHWGAFSTPENMSPRQLMSRTYRAAAPDGMLASRLRKAGYRTMGFSTNPWVSARLGMNEGFDYFDEVWRSGRRLMERYEVLPGEIKISRDVDSGPSGQALLSLKNVFLENPGLSAEGPLFLFLNLIDPHFPYLPPADFVSAFDADPSAIQKMFEPETTAPDADQFGPADTVELALIAGRGNIDFGELEKLYDAELFYVDFVLDRLFDWMKEKGLYEESLIIVTSDHGEHLGEEGRFSHQLSMEEELLRIPLLLRFPEGRDAGQTRDRLTSLIDLYRTVIAFSGAPPEDSDALNGHDLSTAAKQTGRETLFAESYFSEAFLNILHRIYPAFEKEPHRIVRRVVYRGGKKFHFAGTRLTWVERADGTRTPPAGGAEEREVTASLRDYVESLDPGSGVQRGDDVVDPAFFEKLRSLGYVR